VRTPVFFSRNHVFAASRVLACCLVLCAAATLSFAQQQDRQDRDEAAASVRAGGSWRVFDTEDKMTAVHRLSFELLSDNAPAENGGFQYKIALTCENGKLKSSEFTPGRKLGPPDHPGFWGQPKMEVRVRVDNSHGNHGWDWNGDALSMDKGTVRELIGAQVFKIEFEGRRGAEIAEFSPGGLELTKVSQACGLTPKQP
jgi:hypothetical protein